MSGQASAETTSRVDADYMTIVANEQFRSVADDDQFTADVWCGWHVLDRRPTQQTRRLSLHRYERVITSVREDARVCFIGRQASLKELPVAVRNERQVAGVKPGFAAVRVERLFSTIVPKAIEGVEIASGIKHHLVMIAEYRKHTTMFREFDQRFDDAS